MSKTNSSGEDPRYFRHEAIILLTLQNHKEEAMFICLLTASNKDSKHIHDQYEKPLAEITKASYESIITEY